MQGGNDAARSEILRRTLDNLYDGVHFVGRDRTNAAIIVNKDDIGSDLLQQTISVGAGLGDTAQILLGKADKLMYRSKRAGRNCVSSDV